MECKKFCENNHNNGYWVSSVRLGLYYKSELVQVCSFGKSRFNEGEMELVRNCSKLNTTVIGGLQKLVNYFISNYKPEKLTTNCDLRLSDGSEYLLSDWKEVYRTKQNYWYFSNNEYYLHNKMQFKKHKLSNLLENYDDSITEVDNMLNNGWMIYCDCGCMKLEYQQ